MDVYVIVGLLRDSRLEHIAIMKSKFSENCTPLSSPPKVTPLAEEEFRIVQYGQQKLNDGVVQCNLKYEYISACLKWQGNKKFSVQQGQKLH